MNQQLEDYIKQARQSGKTDNQIRQELLGAGWDEGALTQLNNASAKPITIKIISYILIATGLSVLIGELGNLLVNIFTAGWAVGFDIFSLLSYYGGFLNLSYLMEGEQYYEEGLGWLLMLTAVLSVYLGRKLITLNKKYLYGVLLLEFSYTAILIGFWVYLANNCGEGVCVKTISEIKANLKPDDIFIFRVKEFLPSILISIALSLSLFKHKKFFK